MSAAPAPVPRQPFVRIDVSRRERPLVERAVALLRRHGELADQRRAEISRRQLNPLDGLLLSACDACAVSSSSAGTVNNGPGCIVSLDPASISQQARSWKMPATELLAMTVLHGQELCLQSDRSNMAATEAEQRFARKLRNSRLFDRFWAQVDASGRDRATVERAFAIVRRHGELALQRRDEILRRHLNQIDPLRISTCRPCRVDLYGTSTVIGQTGSRSVQCDVVLDMSEIEASARDWGVRVTEQTASALVHLQEHCVRDPDDRETPALAEERRLARKLGSAPLLELVNSEAEQLDATGHWR